MNDGQQIVSKLNNLQVGGLTKSVKVPGTLIRPTGQTYSTGVIIGEGNPVTVELSRSQTGSGIIQTVAIQDNAKQSGAIDIVVFDSNPTSTTFLDGFELDIAAVDLPKVLGVISIASTDYSSFMNNSVATKTNIGFVLQSLNTPNNLFYLAFVSRDGKTYSANDLSVVIGILQD